MEHTDIVVIGGGIVGAATAMALLEEHPGLPLVLLEKEPRLAAHQTGHNSGVIHSGIYYRPGSRKAVTCIAGREALYRFCEAQGIPHERCGKLIVATKEEELPELDRLEQNGRDNGLTGIRRLRSLGEINELEPHAAGIEALFVAETGIVDYAAVTEAMAREIRRRGGTIRTSCRVEGITRQWDGFLLGTSRGGLFCRALINCGGLHCDRIARLCGLSPAIRIIPFRGEYYSLAPRSHSLVRNLIYPVRNPRYPFLGVHFTRMVSGEREAGPNAVLAFKREGYGRHSFSAADVTEMMLFPGFWKMAAAHWREGLKEYRRSLSATRFAEDLRRLVPSLPTEDLAPGGAGVRAQAVDRTGHLVDDFVILEKDRMIHVLNAPSPAATASIAIGRNIALRAKAHLPPA